MASDVTVNLSVKVEWWLKPTIRLCSLLAPLIRREAAVNLARWAVKRGIITHVVRAPEPDRMAG
jgi:hypothetical protein